MPRLELRSTGFARHPIASTSRDPQSHSQEHCHVNSTSRTTARVPVLAAFVLVGAGLVAGCGSSSGGGTNIFSIVSTLFGFDPFSGDFAASGSNGEPPIIPQNMCVIFRLSDTINPATVSTETITVQAVDLSVNPPAPGPDAGISLMPRQGEAPSQFLTICPLILFTDTNVSYGFQPDTTYQILFEVPPSTTTMRSTAGTPLSSSDRGPFYFQTNSVIFDRVPGAPVPTISLLDPDPTDSIPLQDPQGRYNPKPVPDIRIDFNEPVIPTTVISDPVAGASPSIHIELDGDGDPNSINDRTTIPGRYTLIQDEMGARVEWVSLLSEIPTDVAGCIYVVTVDGTVQDLSGNSKVSETGDAGANDTLAFQTVPGAPGGAADPAAESFDTRDNEDQTVTSARWGTTVAGLLTSGVGGGTGVDGVFDPSDPAFQLNPPADVTVDVPNQIVTMDTEDGANPGNPRLYEFLNFQVPFGWVTQAVGPFPLLIQVSGEATVLGILDASGAAGEVFLQQDQEASHGPGNPGAAGLGGFAGGLGGSATFTVGGTREKAFLADKGVGITWGDLGSPPPTLDNQGFTSRLLSVDPGGFQTTVVDGTFDLSTIDVAMVWLAPNLAVDDYRFERAHTPFKVESMSNTGVVDVVSNSADPLFRGPMNLETTNPYLEDDGSGGFRTPILAEECDAFLLGDLTGFPGDAVAVLSNGGNGSEPQAVMQTFSTIGRSGGGGGGGGLQAGLSGADDPTIADGPGLSGGTGWFGATGGTAFLQAKVLSVNGPTQLSFQTDIFDDGTNQGDPAYVGFELNPQIFQGQTFVIASVDSENTCTIASVTTLDGSTLDLSTVPLLDIGSDARVSPPYSAGGSGGGGSGLHCGGAFKDAKGNTGGPDRDGNSDPNVFDDDDNDCLEDFQESIFPTPAWVSGAGGGAGGGALRAVVAGDVTVTSTGRIRVEGGEGGRSDGSGALAASGGGGGSGGTIFIGTGETVTVDVGGQISAAGGLGGALGFGNAGGDGSPGRIRLENALGNMVPGDFAGGATVPAMTNEFLGVFPGGGQTLAQSLFISAGVLSPSYQNLTITYQMNLNGLDTSAQYVVQPDGTVDPTSTIPVPPFDVSVNFTTADPDSGLPVLPPIDPTFRDPATPLGQLSLHDGEQYVRFKVILPDASQTLNIGGDLIRNVQVQAVSFAINGIKP